MPWDPRIQALVDRYPVLRAVGDTPLVPVEILNKELPDVEVFAKLESLSEPPGFKDSSFANTSTSGSSLFRISTGTSGVSPTARSTG